MPSEKELIDEIRRLADGNEPPTLAKMNSDGKYSETSYISCFGLWSVAIKKAGYEPRINKINDNKISREDLLTEITRLADGDKPPSIAEMDKSGKYASMTYYNRFGTWSDAIKEAGYESYRDRRRISEDELLREIHRLASGSEPPTTNDMDNNGKFSTRTYSNHFDSWNSAVKKAGYEPRTSYTRDNLIEEIHRLADGDCPPSTTLMDKKGGPSASTFIRIFGSWKDAVEAAGYDYNLHTITADELLSDIHKLANGATPPSYEEMVQYGEYSMGTYQNRFGSWTKAKELAGYPTEKPPTADELIEEIHNLADGHKPPTQCEMRSIGEFTPSQYLNHWDYWNDAVREAGYSPNLVVNISKDDLIADLNRLATKLGRPPRVHEVNELGKYSEMPYLSTFDDWWTALIRAGLRPRRMYPLSPEAFVQLHGSIIKNRSTFPRQSLVTLLFMFTGLNPSMVHSFSENWIKQVANDYLITVPSEYTSTSKPWEFRIPETWCNPVSGETERTMLPKYVKWFFETYDDFNFERQSVYKPVYRTSRDAGLLDYREPLTTDIGVVPHVRPVDLRITFGVHMARNGAPREYIERRLGLNHLSSYITVDKIFTWIDSVDNVPVSN